MPPLLPHRPPAARSAHSAFDHGVLEHDRDAADLVHQIGVVEFAPGQRLAVFSHRHFDHFVLQTAAPDV